MFMPHGIKEGEKDFLIKREIEYYIVVCCQNAT